VLKGETFARLVCRLQRHPVRVIAVSVGLAAVGAVLALRLDVSAAIDTLIDRDSVRFQATERYKRDFGEDPISILVQGGDMEEPIADEVRGILDGHVILNRDLGARNHWPAIDVLPSLSRVMSGIATPEHKKAAGKMRQVMATYEKNRDLILLGAYQYGTDPNVDYAIDKIQEVEAFLRQGTYEATAFEETTQRIIDMFADAQE